MLKITANIKLGKLVGSSGNAGGSGGDSGSSGDYANTSLSNIDDSAKDVIFNNNFNITSFDTFKIPTAELTTNWYTIEDGTATKNYTLFIYLGGTKQWSASYSITMNSKINKILFTYSFGLGFGNSPVLNVPKGFKVQIRRLDDTQTVDGSISCRKMYC